MEVTVRAGTTLSELNILLEDHGLAVKILGSISEQTVGGAISTGIHMAYVHVIQYNIYSVIWWGYQVCILPKAVF